MTAKLPDAARVPGEAFERAAELFGVLATPVRLKIIGELCVSEKNVSHLLAAIDVSQPNMSRHLGVLHKAGVVSRRRHGAHVIYALINPSVVSICKAVCTQMDAEVAASHRAIAI
jgi:DNA-binding transcriptional ArsR family regulator